MGKSGRFHLAIASRPVSFDTKSQKQCPRFHRLRDGYKLPKNRLWRICIKKIAKIKMTGSIMGPAGEKKVKSKNKIKITGSIIGPAMAGPTGPFATALKYHNEQ